jgi:tetratricopeptide (TPR) repeat protein
MRRACEALNKQSDQPGLFSSRLALADLYIEDRDWQRLREALDLREHDCGEMRLRRAQISVLWGILSLGEEKPDEAERHFNRALEARKDDLDLIAYRGRALLGAKRYETALREFERLLYKAPGHVNALLGKARACIELGDAGDPEQYKTAEKSLTEALRYGRDGGSLVLRDAEKSNIYYTRGYSKTKRYDANTAVSRSALILSALDDFRQAKKIDPLNFDAQSAFSKLARRVAAGARDSLSRAIGTILISALAFLVFAFAQIDFFLPGSRLHDALQMPEHSLLDPGWYATITFLSLAMLIAGLSLRDLLKLKVAGIELEKTSTDRSAQALPLGLGRLGQFDNNDLRGPGSRPRDEGTGTSEGAAAKLDPSSRPQSKEDQTSQGLRP